MRVPEPLPMPLIITSAHPGGLWYQIEVRDRRYYCLEDLITLYIRVEQNPRLGIGNIGKGLDDARVLPYPLSVQR